MSEKPKQKRVWKDHRVFKEDIVHRKMPERPICDTYFYLLEKYPKDTWDSLSWRKQICLGFLEWMTFPDRKELVDPLVEKVKAWRKKEKRVGGKRSLLERQFRKKLFRKHTKERNYKNRPTRCDEGNRQVKNKTGMFTPERFAERCDPNSDFHKRRVEKMKARPPGSKGLDWIVTSPWGDVYHVKGLQTICEENGLDASHLSKTAKHAELYHRGWKARKKNLDWPL